MIYLGIDMTPKEKAEELVVKYMFLLNVDSAISKTKQCALLVVNEILNNIQFDEYLTEYWQEVKQEIEKL